MRKLEIMFRIFGVIKPRFLLHLPTKKVVWGVTAMFLVLALLPVNNAYAAANYQINYQGKLTDSADATVADGDYDIVFNLYTAATGGVAIWTESHTGANDVTVTNGLFSVMLGSITSLATVNFNQTLYLGVTIEADSEMTPRKTLGAVPAAFQADMLDGLDSTDFLSTSTASAPKLWSLTGLGNIGSSTASTTVLGNLAAVGNTIVQGLLSAYQQITAPYFVATSTTASVLPYASSTAISVSGAGFFDKLGVASSSLSANHSLVVSGNVHIGGTITATSTATSTFSGPISLTKLNTSATSTGTNGFDISAGCYAINGTCISGGGGSGTVSSGLAGQLAYYASDGTTVTGTTTGVITAGTFVATTSTASILPYASTTAITVSGTASTTDLIVSNSATIGSLSGILSASTGAVSAFTTSQANPLYFNGTTIAPTSTPTFATFHATSTTASSTAGTIVLSKIVTSATSTGTNGFDISAGCYAINGTCVGGGNGSGTVNSGTIGGLAYYTGSTAVSSAGTSLYWDNTNKVLGIATTTQTGYLFSRFINGGNPLLTGGPVFDATTTFISSGVSDTAPRNGGIVYIARGGNNSGAVAAAGNGGTIHLADGGDHVDPASTAGIGGIINMVRGGHDDDNTYENDGTVDIGNGSGQKNASLNLFGGLRIDTSSTTAFYINNSTTRHLTFDSTNGVMGIGSSTPSSNFRLSLGGNLYVGGTITATSTATSTFSGPISLTKLHTSATSTGTNGFDISTGCYAVRGTCISGGGGSGTVSSGLAGQLAYYASDGTTVTGTTTGVITAGTFVATTSTASILPYASSTGLTVSGASYFGSGSPTGIWRSDGIVGIGTSSPNNITGFTDNALQVDGHVGLYSTAPKIQFWESDSGRLVYVTNNSGTLSFTTNSVAVNYSFSPRNYADALFIDDGAGGAKVGVGATTTPGAQLTASSTVYIGLMVDQRGSQDILALLNNGSRVLTVTNDGSLGIGTTTPGAKLGIQGDIFLAGRIVSTSTTATSTFAAPVSVTKIVTSATSTGTNGFDITAGCYAINGTCISGGAATSPAGNDTYVQFNDGGVFGGVAGFTFEKTPVKLTVTHASTSKLSITGGFLDFTSNDVTSTIKHNSPYAWTLATSTSQTNPFLRVDTTAGAEQVVFGLSSGDVIIGGVGQATNLVFEESSSINAQGTGTLTFGTTGDLINFAVPLGIGTTSPSTNFKLIVAGGNAHFGGTITATSTATSTFSGPISLTKLNTSATSTGTNGFDISAGCYAINGTCVGGGSGSGTVSSGSLGGLAYYTGATTVTGTSTLTFNYIEASSDSVLSLGTSSNSDGYLFSTFINSGDPFAGSLSPDNINASTTYIGTGQASSAIAANGFNGASVYIALGGDYTGSTANSLTAGLGGTIYLADGGDSADPQVTGGLGGVVYMVRGGISDSSPSGNDGVVYIGNSTGLGNASLHVYGSTTISNRLGIGTSSPSANFKLSVAGDVHIGGTITSTSTATSTFLGTLNVMFRNTATTNGVCHSGTDLDDIDTTNIYSLVACSSAPGDIAEFYPTQSEVEAGDIVATTEEVVSYEAEGADPVTGQIKPLGNQELSILKKASSEDIGVLGVVSTGPFQTFGKDVRKSGHDTQPVALVGRVPVKVNLDGGPIKPGDKIALSSTPGVGMKAGTSSPVTIGTALSAFNEDSDQDESGVGRVTVFIDLSHAKLSSAIAGGNLADGLWGLDETTGQIKAFAALDLAGQDINNVGAIKSASGNWSISTDGILTTKEIRTEKLCLGSICVDEDDLRELLNRTGIGVTETFTEIPDDEPTDSDNEDNNNSEVPPDDSVGSGADETATTSDSVIIDEGEDTNPPTPLPPGDEQSPPAEDPSITAEEIPEETPVEAESSEPEPPADEPST